MTDQIVPAEVIISLLFFNSSKRVLKCADAFSFSVKFRNIRLPPSCLCSHTRLYKPLSAFQNRYYPYSNLIYPFVNSFLRNSFLFLQIHFYISLLFSHLHISFLYFLFGISSLAFLFCVFLLSYLRILFCAVVFVSQFQSHRNNLLKSCQTGMKAFWISAIFRKTGFFV